MIYTIMVSTDYKLDEKTKTPYFGDSRVVGYYTNYDMAIDAVKNNTCDIHECCYNYAFVESVGEGLYNCAGASERDVFVWTNDFGYTKIKDFECMKHFCGYTIG